MVDANVTLQASVTKTASFAGAALDLKTGTAPWRNLFARILYSAASNASGLNSFQFFIEHADVDKTATITGASVTTGSTPSVITAANTFAAGDIVTISGVVGTTTLNGTFVVSATNLSASQFSVNDFNGNPVIGTGAYSSGGAATTWSTMASPAGGLITLTVNAQSGELVIPIQTRKRYVRLSVTEAGGGSTPTITYKGDVMLGRP